MTKLETEADCCVGTTMGVLRGYMSSIRSLLVG